MIPPNWLRALPIYLGSRAIGHFVWETLQLPLYTIWTAQFRDQAFAVIHCTLVVKVMRLSPAEMPVSAEFSADARVPSVGFAPLATGRLALFSFFVLLIFMEAGNCQASLIPNSRATSPLQHRLTLQSEGTNAAFTVHRNNFGKPCLHIEAASRRHVINPHVFDHVISVLNNCPKNIQLRVCYYKSDHCIDMEIPGSKRKDGVLGVFPGMQYFRYSYREKL